MKIYMDMRALKRPFDDQTRGRILLETQAVMPILDALANGACEVSQIAEYPSLKPRWWTGRDHQMLVASPSFLEQSKRNWIVGRDVGHAGKQTEATGGACGKVNEMGRGTGVASALPAWSGRRFTHPSSTNPMVNHDKPRTKQLRRRTE